MSLFGPSLPARDFCFYNYFYPKRCGFVCDVRDLDPADRISEGWGSRLNAERRAPLGWACVREAIATAGTVCALEVSGYFIFGQRNNLKGRVTTPEGITASVTGRNLNRQSYRKGIYWSILRLHLDWDYISRYLKLFGMFEINLDILNLN